jgi:hypothetical protein
MMEVSFTGKAFDRPDLIFTAAGPWACLILDVDGGGWYANVHVFGGDAERLCASLRADDEVHVEGCMRCHDNDRGLPLLANLVVAARSAEIVRRRAEIGEAKPSPAETRH